jgi:hypothetical protein
MMVVDNKFSIGDYVYLVTDLDQLKRVVVSILITDGSLIYGLNCGMSFSEHSACEISDEVDVLIKSDN